MLWAVSCETHGRGAQVEMEEAMMEKDGVDDMPKRRFTTLETFLAALTIRSVEAVNTCVTLYTWWNGGVEQDSGKMRGSRVSWSEFLDRVFFPVQGKWDQELK